MMNQIYSIKGHKVMIDRDLAQLYKVTTENFNKAVQRNLKRFPENFMFQLSKEEFKSLIFRNGTSRWAGTRKQPCIPLGRREFLFSTRTVTIFLILSQPKYP
jgi:hypothetical protein